MSEQSNNPAPVLAAVGFMSYNRPETETHKVSRVITKRIDDMTPEEVLEAYRQNVPEDWEPTPEQKTINEAYEMPIEDLYVAANKQLRDAYNERREQYRTQNAVTFMANEPRYKKSLANAEKMVAALDEFNLEGSVNDMQVAFNHLASKGELELNAPTVEPKKVYSKEEFSSLSLDEMQAAIAQMKRDGVI